MATVPGRSIRNHFFIIIKQQSFVRSSVSSPQLGGLKRSRSETPPGGVKINSDDSLRSPLAKRKRLVSERSDQS